MNWYPSLAMQFGDAPLPATKEELLDYAERSCLSPLIIENLEELEDDDRLYYEMVDLGYDVIVWDRCFPSDDEY